MIVTSTQIFSALAGYRYLMLFPLVVIEGPIVTVIAAFLASLGYMNIAAVYSIVVIADVTGDCLYYAIGRWGGRRFVDRWGRFIGITRNRLEHLEAFFLRSGRRALVFGKLTHGIGGPILIAAGIARMKPLDFLIFTFLPTIPKSLLLAAAGFYFGKAYRQIGSAFGYVGLAVIGIAFMILAVIAFHRYFPKSTRERR